MEILPLEKSRRVCWKILGERRVILKEKHGKSNLPTPPAAGRRRVMVLLVDDQAMVARRLPSFANEPGLDTVPLGLGVALGG